MRRLIISCIGLVALLLGACQGAAPTATVVPTATATAIPSPTATTPPTATRTATPAPTVTATAALPPMATASPASASGTFPEALSLLMQAEEAMAGVRTYHLMGKMQVKESREAVDPLLEATLDGQGAIGGDYQAVVVVTMRIQGLPIETPMEFRGVEGVSYAKDPLSGKWAIDESAQTSSVMEDFAGLSAAFGQQFAPRTAEVALDTADGLPMYRISGQTIESGRTTTIQIWVERDSKLIRRMRSDGTAPASDYQQFAPTSSGMVYESQDMRFDRFNEPIQVEKVEIPAPVPGLPSDGLAVLRPVPTASPIP